jgi:uncharacterized coiled-coil DUF342 family protein
MSDDIIDKARGIPRGIGGYHHDIVQEMIAEIERLREQLRLANIDCFNTTAEVDTLRAERDEANANAKLYRDDRDAARAEATFLRPSVCLGAQTASEYAKTRGWDCFKEPAHAS